MMTQTDEPASNGTRTAGRYNVIGHFLCGETCLRPRLSLWYFFISQGRTDKREYFKYAVEPLAGNAL